MHIIELPTEIVEEILAHCDPIEVAKAAQTCSALRALIYGSQDSKLWRNLYLAQPFDDLRKCISNDGQPAQVDWKRNLQGLIRARNIVANLSLLKPGELQEILQTLLRMILCHPPRTPNTNKTTSALNLLWISDILRHDFIDQAEDLKSLTFTERQLLSRLHCYYGLTEKDMERQSRVDSRAYVYTMRKYRPDNEYGPFCNNGTVNWEHIQALRHVVCMHLVDMSGEEGFEFPMFPMSLSQMQIVIPVVPDGEEEKQHRNWAAALEGSWTVAFCFCDHRDLLQFNEASETQLDTSMFEDPGFREIFRSLDVKLYVTQTEPDPAHPTTPILHFFGEMEGLSSSTMTGRVKMTVDNQVQWHFVSGDQGNAIWSCEGVQVGGLRSSFGVLGSWTTIFHEADDPIGPFWLRKYGIEP